MIIEWPLAIAAGSLAKKCTRGVQIYFRCCNVDSLNHGDTNFLILIFFPGVAAESFLFFSFLFFSSFFFLFSFFHVRPHPLVFFFFFFCPSIFQTKRIYSAHAESPRSSPLPPLLPDSRTDDPREKRVCARGTKTTPRCRPTG